MGKFKFKILATTGALTAILSGCISPTVTEFLGTNTRSTPTPSATPLSSPRPTTPTPVPATPTPVGPTPTPIAGTMKPINITQSLAPGTINGAILAPNHAAVHLTATPVGLNYGPINNLKKIATGEYATGLLTDDGKIWKVIGTNTVLAPLNVSSTVTFIDYVGGLHQSMALDNTGHVWTWGSHSGTGLPGSGSVTVDPEVPFKILKDAYGADFDNIALVRAAYSQNLAVKNDGSLWIWGDLSHGEAGDGSLPGIVNAPVKVPFPTGVKIKDVYMGVNFVYALDTDGNVWSWGGNGGYGTFANLARGASPDATRPGKVQGLPAGITAIAAGNSFAVALAANGTLYGWGSQGGFLGNLPAGAADQNGMVAVPQNLSTMHALPLPVKKVAVNDNTTHVILNDGSLWGWGDDAMGEVGDGQMLNYSIMNWAWDWLRADLLVKKAVRILPSISNFKEIYTNTALVFYVFAVTEDKKVFSWGRNKTGNLMNGIVQPLYTGISAQYPNSWDICVPMQVNPFQLDGTIVVTSPYCVLNPSGVPCNQYTGK